MRKPNVYEYDAATRIVDAIANDLANRTRTREEREQIDPRSDAVRAEWHRLALKEVLRLADGK